MLAVSVGALSVICAKIYLIGLGKNIFNSATLENMLRQKKIAIIKERVAKNEMSYML